jgi:bacteriocin biosynthesis cyclodehydratase domain-containing protein
VGDLRRQRRLLQLHVLLLLRRVSEAAPRVPPLPLLKPWYRVLALEDRVLLEHGRAVVVFEGAAARTLLPALLPLLDGSRSVDAVCSRLGAPVRPAVENALQLLAENGLLTGGPRLAADDARREVAESLLAESAGADALEVAARLATARVVVLGDEERCDGLGRLLQRSGVAAAQGADPSADLTVVGPGEDRRAWNGRALENGGAWLPFGAFDGLVTAVGPLVVPHETACWECVRLRVESTSGCAGELRLFRDEAEPTGPRPGVLGCAAAIAAEIVLRWVGVRDPALPGTLFTVSSEKGISIAAHTVLRVPRCPSCSPAAGLAPPSPWHEAQAA